MSWSLLVFGCCYVESSTQIETGIATMETDSDLSTLIDRNDHLNVLRYIRVHQLREPELVVAHGKVLIESNRLGKGDLARLAVLEQVCLAALDVGDPETARMCLSNLQHAGISDESLRFKLLLARCLEAAEDYSGAEISYDELLEENPANLLALKRKYCILKAQVGKQAETMEALNAYLQQNYSDAAAWLEMSELRMEVGDYEGAAFALEEVILGSPSDANLHVQLAECYVTMGKYEHLLLARKHCAQALELDPGLRRAQFSLVVIANAYLLESPKIKDDTDEHESMVAQQLIRYGSERLLEAYAGTETFAAVQNLMSQYAEGL
jgi:tetratricopeptide (TPR) repeat protein